MRGGACHSLVHVPAVCRLGPLSCASLSRASPCGVHLRSCLHQLHPLRLPGGRAGAGKDYGEINLQVGVTITIFRGGSGLRTCAEEIGELRPLIKKQNVVILPPTPIYISDTAISGGIELFPSLPPNKNRDGRVSL